MHCKLVDVVHHGPARTPEDPKIPHARGHFQFLYRGSEDRKKRKFANGSEHSLAAELGINAWSRSFFGRRSDCAAACAHGQTCLRGNLGSTRGHFTYLPRLLPQVDVNVRQRRLTFHVPRYRGSSSALSCTFLPWCHPPSPWSPPHHPDFLGLK